MDAHLRMQQNWVRRYLRCGGSGVFVGVSACFLAGCGASHPEYRTPTTAALALASVSGLTKPEVNENLQAVVVPPVGWRADPPKVTDRHYHIVWLSPTGLTAYGVIYFKLPFPVGLNITLDHFIAEMKKQEGEATLLERKDDDQLPGIRFTARGAVYTLRANLTVSGFHGWAVYAGTLTNKPVNAAELHTAESAREQTRVGL